MTTQYGIWHFDDSTVDLEKLSHTESRLRAFAPDGVSSYVQPCVGMLCGSFRTLPESQRESQPQLLPSGAVLLWDGRLDNRTELIAGSDLSPNASDVEIVAAWYWRSGSTRLDRVIGDWALSVWDPEQRSLLLARDFLGTRHLYYRLTSRQIAWSTVLDLLVHAPGDSLTLSSEYLAGTLASLPAAHLTPYNEVRAVPPSSYVLIHPRRVIERRYWDFDPEKKVRYRSDSEYQEHFRDLFRESVRARLRSNAPVVAELSGGMDSSSIVCVADDLLAQKRADCPDLATLSYFTTSEPDWDEEPYFTTVEQRRGRCGFHVDLGSCGFFRFAYDPGTVSLAPSASPKTRADLEIDRFFAATGHRVVLSGIGGDEFLGGVPAASPELADLFSEFRFGALARQLKYWALAQRKPWCHLLGAAVRDFLPVAVRFGDRSRRPAPWICRPFAADQRHALAGYPDRIRLFGPRPSFQHAVGTVEVLRRTLAWAELLPSRLCEKRYPYLDRSLLEFLFAIPREQLLRPGYRRSLMRMAMRGTVPDRILTRKRKAFVSRAPVAALRCEWDSVAAGEGLLTAALGIVQGDLFLKSMQDALAGREVPILPVVRTLALECWLRQLARAKVVPDLNIAQKTQIKDPARFFFKKGGENDELREAGSCGAR